MKPQIKLSLLDKAINYVSPTKGLKRTQAKIHQASLSSNGYVTNKNKRSLRGYPTKSYSSDKEDLPQIPKLRAISRELYRNVGLCHGSLDTISLNVIGFGLTLQAQIDESYLGLNEEEARAWEENTEFEFRLWCESSNCDTSTTNNFYELQNIAFLSLLVDGDIFVATPLISRQNSPYSLSINLIEADRVTNPNNKMDTLEVAGGVECDVFGSPKAYHILKNHPEGLARQKEWVKVNAFGENGYKNIFHVYTKKRPGQRRGVPILAPVLELLKQLGDYTQAELTAAIVSGLYTVFITTEEGDLDIDDGESKDNEDIKMEAGMIVGLNPGEKVATSNPNRPNTAFEPFIQAIIKQFGASLNLPYEVVMKHFTASYSASRGALLEAWKMFKARRASFSSQFNQPLYEKFLEEAVILGRINAPGFLEDPAIRKAYSGATWNGPVQGQLNQLNETKASILRCDNGLSNRTREASETNGSDFDKNIKRAKSEQKKMKEAGLIQNEETDKPSEELQ